MTKIHLAQARFKNRTMRKVEYNYWYAVYRLNALSVPHDSFADTFKVDTLLGHLTWAWSEVYWMDYPDSVAHYVPITDAYERIWSQKMTNERREGFVSTIDAPPYGDLGNGSAISNG